MSATAAPALSDDELVEMLSLIKGADSVELKLTIPEPSQRSTIAGARHRSARRPGPPRVLLRHAGPDAREGRRRRARAPRRSARATTRWSSCGPSCPPSCRASCASRRVRGRGRRDARRLRLLGVAEGPARRTPVRDVGRATAPLRKLFSKEQRAFFAEHAPEGIGLEDLSLLGPIFVLKLKGVPAGLRAQDGRRAVAVPRRHADPRALDEVRARRRPSRSPPRPRLPGRARHRDRRRRADHEDAQGAGVLLQAARQGLTVGAASGRWTRSACSPSCRQPRTPPQPQPIDPKAAMPGASPCHGGGVSGRSTRLVAGSRLWPQPT